MGALQARPVAVEYGEVLAWETSAVLNALSNYPIDTPEIPLNKRVLTLKSLNSGRIWGLEKERRQLGNKL